MGQWADNKNNNKNNNNNNNNVNTNNINNSSNYYNNVDIIKLQNKEGYVHVKSLFQIRWFMLQHILPFLFFSRKKTASPCK